jgi:CRP/FNR family transcriptional regulator, cyclic AMP receptor protein
VVEELNMPIDPRVLLRSTAFQLLDDEELAELGAHIDEGSFAAGEHVFRADEPGGTMHVVLEGHVETYIVDEAGERVLLAQMGPGEMFGELSLLDGKPRSANALATEPTRTFLIDQDDLERLFAKKPRAAIDVLTVLTRRIRVTDQLLSRRVSRNANEVLEEKATFGDRVSDGVARFGGSWSFIFSFGAILVGWVLLNTLFAPHGSEAFDPFPFILLNLFLSALAALQAPVIMMSQNRQDAKDRVRSELDYQVNLKAELEIMQLHEKFDRLQARPAAAASPAGAPPRPEPGSFTRSHEAASE